ncbi:hypothetical protein [Labilithrix luteola]|uniref:hypothetical protein n=1 Tax=Labilithrix luteola TaxID=1391654 RepID=UPI0011BAC2DF|nr:hypothetical protein [Labilithrix luteola]
MASSTRRQGIALLTVVAGCAGGLIAACQVVAGIERVDKGSEVPSSPSAETDAGDAASNPPGDPCVHAGLPGLPEVDNDPTRELPTIVMAVDTSTINPNGVSAEGVDLDGVCTCDTRLDTAHGGASSCVRAGEPICDGDGGVDSHFAAAVAAFTTAFDRDDFTRVNETIRLGRTSLLLFLRKYNGLANDRDVELGIVASNGLRDSHCPDSVEGPLGFYSPGWCGDDEWTVFPDTIVNGFPIAYTAGHVSDYRLVVELDYGIPIPFGNVQVVAGSPITFGRLVPLGDDLKPRDPARPPATANEQRFYRIEDGLISGRVAATDMLAGLGSSLLPDSVGGGRLCQNPTLYSLVHDRICGALDIAKSKKLDFADGYACDAVSTSIYFTAAPARFGKTDTSPQEENGCAAVDGGPIDSGSSVTTYSCK